MGVSNYSLEQTKQAAEALQTCGIPLASNQVEYHLLERRIEKNGLMAYCQANNIQVIAYSPLAMGILSGKYTPDNPPKGTRSAHYNRSLLESIQPLIRLMKSIAADHGGKTASQVALNWLMAKGTIPIPGAKNVHQVELNAGALGWNLTENEIHKLEETSDSVSLITE